MVDKGDDQNGGSRSKWEAYLAWECVFGVVSFLGAIGAIGTMIAVELSSGGSRSFWEAALIGYPAGLVIAFAWNFLQSSTCLELGINSGVLLILALLAYPAYTGYKERARQKQGTKAPSAQVILPGAQSAARFAGIVYTLDGAMLPNSRLQWTAPARRR